MPVAQKLSSLLHFSLFQKGADVGGGHPDALHGLLRYHRAGAALLLAKVRQKLSRARALPSKAKITAADKARRTVIAQKHFNKILPGHSHQAFRKGQFHHRIHRRQQHLLPILIGIDQWDRYSCQQPLRVA